MKYVQRMGIASLMMSLTACVPGGGSGSGPVTTNVDNGSQAGATNCSTTASGGNMTMTCDNGMVITASAASMSGFKGPTGSAGATGATGPQGAQGPQGVAGTAAPVWKLINGNGVQVGDYLMGGIASPTEGYSVWDKTNAVAVPYSYNGMPYSGSLYFESSNCTGIPFAINTSAVNTVFQNTGVFYKVDSTTGGTHTFFSYLGDGQGCTSIGGMGTTAVYPEVSVYSNANMPTRLTLPVTVTQ